MPAGAGLVDGPCPVGFWKSSAWLTGFEPLGAPRNSPPTRLLEPRWYKEAIWSSPWTFGRP